MIRVLTMLLALALPVATGHFRGSIGFGAALPDEQIVVLLRRHDVLPYAVYFALPGARGIHEVPRSGGSLSRPAT